MGKIMHKFWKLLTSSLIVALNLTTPLAVYGIERDAKRLRGAPSEETSPLSLSEITNVEGLEAITPNYIRLFILKQIVKERCREYGDATDLALLSKKWSRLIKEKVEDASKYYNFNFSQGALEGYTPDTFEECCQLDVFLHGKFVFLRDDPVHRVEFPIADFPNPFRSSLDLSKCIKPKWAVSPLDKLLRIGTGSRDLNEDVDLTYLNVIPLFWIKKELRAGRAEHLRPIYVDLQGRWKPNAIIGLFLAWGEDDVDQFACVTTESSPQSAKSFYETFYSNDKEHLGFNELVTLSDAAPLPHVYGQLIPAMSLTTFHLFF
jgi:hypothetical protein